MIPEVYTAHVHVAVHVHACIIHQKIGVHIANQATEDSISGLLALISPIYAYLPCACIYCTCICFLLL